MVAGSFLQAVPKRASAMIVRSTRKVFFISFPLGSVVYDCRDLPGLSIV